METLGQSLRGNLGRQDQLQVLDCLGLGRQVPIGRNAPLACWPVRCRSYQGALFPQVHRLLASDLHQTRLAYLQQLELVETHLVRSRRRQNRRVSPPLADQRRLCPTGPSDPAQYPTNRPREKHWLLV